MVGSCNIPTREAQPGTQKRGLPTIILESFVHSFQKYARGCFKMLVGSTEQNLRLALFPPSLLLAVFGNWEGQQEGERAELHK